MISYCSIFYYCIPSDFERPMLDLYGFTKTLNTFFFVALVTLAISKSISFWSRSFLDTQYTFRLAKLKLKLRSSIMTLIYEKVC